MELTFTKEVLKRLEVLPRAHDHATFYLLGKNEDGVIVDFSYIVPTDQRCYTPEMLNSSITAAYIELAKKGLMVGAIFVVDSVVPNDVSGGYRSQLETVREWFHHNSYALEYWARATMGDDVIYVKEGFAVRENRTGILVKAWEAIEDIVFKIK